MLKIGDKMVRTSWTGKRHMPVAVVAIVKVGKMWAFGPGRIGLREKYRVDMEPATLEQIQEAEAYQAEKERAREESIRKIAERNADPKTPYINRFCSGMDQWERLTLDQLKQISTWLDESKAKQ